MTDLVLALAAAGEDERRALLEDAARNTAKQAGLAAQIQTALVASLYTDPAQARRLASAARAWAAHSGGDLAAAYAQRGDAHLAFVQGEHAEAALQYAAAAGAFAALGADTEEARTRSSGLQALIYLGRYDEARQWAERAEAVFLRHHDALRLARLDSNVGNIHFRLDQPQEAIRRYERALETFLELGDGKDIAAALSNLVVSHTSLGHFREALGYYERTRQLCRSQGLAPLSAQADYNIAYLYFLRGDYAEARQAYQHSRQVCRETGDAYHAALCDLDESELLLEINLAADGETLARRAAAAFATLGMRYEEAKAYVNSAVAASQLGEPREAGGFLRRARALFAAEGNPVWPALIDLLRAVLAFHAGRSGEAQRLGKAAGQALEGTMMPSRAAHCQLLLARLWLAKGQPDRARAVGRQALARAGQSPSPSLLFHAHLLEGEVYEQQERWPQAITAYEAARGVLEDLRGRLDTEDLRISLLKDKLAVYEALVSLCLDSPLADHSESPGRALLLVQQAKSRSLADRLLQPGTEPAGTNGAGAEADSLRRDLNWHYRQIELAALLQRSGLAGVSADELRQRAAVIERQLLEEQARHQPAPPPFARTAESLATLRAAIPAGGALVEYYKARGVLWAFVLRATGLDVVRLGSTARLREECKLLQFQLGKASVARAGLSETHHHLGELYGLLIRPLEAALTGVTHLVVAPHRQLHGVPFAALHDGEHALVDRFALSFTPSASVHAACRNRQSAAAHSAVMAVPDPRNKHIESEAMAVARLIPESQLFLGDSATREEFLRQASCAHIVHLAAHGIFRRDNPLFSALQLADERLSLLDLSAARFHVDLLTLSSCNSGVSVPVGGDELLGLMRGFLAAGVRRLVVSLWEVDDASTSEFMRAFYLQLGLGVPIARAMTIAARQVRDRYPHPYHWAPFILVGDAS